MEAHTDWGKWRMRLRHWMRKEGRKADAAAAYSARSLAHSAVALRGRGGLIPKAMHARLYSEELMSCTFGMLNKRLKRLCNAMFSHITPASL